MSKNKENSRHLTLKSTWCSYPAHYVLAPLWLVNALQIFKLKFRPGRSDRKLLMTAPQSRRIRFGTPRPTYPSSMKGTTGIKVRGLWSKHVTADFRPCAKHKRSWKWRCHFANSCWQTFGCCCAECSNMTGTRSCTPKQYTENNSPTVVRVRHNYCYFELYMTDFARTYLNCLIS